MKMTPLLWRAVSVWLCVAVVPWYPSCYVGCTESHQEAQRTMSPQDVGSEEKSGGKSPHEKVEESWVLPVQSLEEPLFDDNQQNKEETTQHMNIKERYSESLEVKVPNVEGEAEADKEMSQSEPETEPNSEGHENPETSVAQEQDSPALLPSPDPVSGFSTELKDNPSIINLQDSVTKKVIDDASDVASPDVLESELPPADCEEEKNNPYDNDSSLPIVLENTSNVHNAGTKTHTDPHQTSSVGEGTQHLEVNTSHVATEQDLSSPVTTDTDSSVSSKDPEDIPTFDEWKRKMMEVEKEKTLSTHPSNNGASHTLKKAQKNFNNYASVECGAKILGANQEAKSTSAILKENMDLYMLNPCSNKIWFIIELCEPIQVKQLDIANFELFSSTPKDFLVSISDRYPTNKWLKLGTFHARDERTVQSFPLDEHLYAKYVKMFTKYIKVELVSHFGSEHFCPLSLIRVFGTSMVEEYEEIADPPERPDEQDDDLDSPSGYGSGEVKLSNNLIGSAKDVILNMVNNIAVNVLGGGPEMQVNISSQEENATEPSAQIETTTQTASTDPTSVPDSEEAVILTDPSIPVTGAPSPETPETETPETETPETPKAETPEAKTPETETPETETPDTETPETETPDTETSKQELPLVEDKIIIPLEKDQEEHISSTITLLEEEELNEEKDNMDHHKRQDNRNYCTLLPSFSSSCSCTVSLQEYLLLQCSTLLSKKRKCQTADRKQRMPSTTPKWHLPLAPSACPDPQLHHTEVHQLHEKEPPSVQEPESEASPSGALQPLGNTLESHKEHESEPPLLEPSQTSSLPKPSATDSSATKPTPIVETPQPPHDETAKEQRPGKSLDVLAAEKYTEPSVSLSSSIYVKPSVSATVDNVSVEPTEEKPDVDVSRFESNTPVPIPDKTDDSQLLPPPTSVHLEHHPDPLVVPKFATTSPEPPHPAPDPVTELQQPSGGPAVITETKMEDLTEDISTSSGGNLPPPSPASPSLSDIYAETPNGTEQNSNLVHSSSQKESVFMRLNNRIKALEMNMSLSGRYLEQLSQRYRKQMEEMQKAFNKTIIKLQNTSRIAEEQDLRQTESIQLLQGQLENVTLLVLNLSDRVSQLQNEVSDRQNYLLLSLALCVCLCLLLCANHCRIFRIPPATEPEPPIPKSYTYCCPERQTSSCDETGLKRSASYPLIHSESFQLASTEGPEMLHAEETQSLCPANRKRRRRKMKPIEKVETLKPSIHEASELSNGGVLCNGVPITTNPTPFANRFLLPLFRDSLSEGSSEGSSHSDDPSFCGITTACSRICDGLPQAKTRAEKRALRRRRPKPGCTVVDLLQVPQRDRREPLAISTIEDLMNRKTEQSSGTFGVNVALSGSV